MKKTLFLLFCVIALTVPFAVCKGERTHSPIIVNIPKPGIGVHRPEICVSSFAAIHPDLGWVLVRATAEQKIKVSMVSDDLVDVQEYVCDSFTLLFLPSNSFDGYVMFEEE